ncbi:MAG: Tex-like N-terminal domain-containing protein, partial [Oleiharenicola lentus]
MWPETIRVISKLHGAHRAFHSAVLFMDLPNPEHVLLLATELKLKVHQVAATAQLLKEGATVPFISRYRKEVTGELDEVQVTAIRDRLEQMAQVDERRAAILASLKERNLLTPALEAALARADTLTKLEDIYLPYRPKKRTRATIAKEKGLEPLAELLWAQDPATDALTAAQAHVGREFTLDDGKNTAGKIENAEDALAGARDILAERISDDAPAREKLRVVYRAQATVASKVLYGKETDPEAAKFKDYFDWSESLAKAPSHRVLAMRRGEKEGFLLMRITLPDEDAASAEVAPLFVRARNAAADQVRLALADAR